MVISVQCDHCGRRLKTADSNAGRKGQCPTCGEDLEIPASPIFEELPPPRTAMEITEWLDPPETPEPADDKPRISIARKMMEAALDPRSIQWLLFFGGGLTVLGLLVWLISLGFFKNTITISVCLGVGSLAVLASGWMVALKTKYRIAGQALTFLGCVILPINLWYWHAQDLITLDNHLWVGGVLCCLIYAATVYVLRDALFLYAVEGGVTLTVLLLLADLQIVSDTTWLSLFFVVMGAISIHLERVFAVSAPEFTREKYGLPLFWSGHAQLAAGVLILLGTQVASVMASANLPIWTLEWSGNLLSQNTLLAGGLWVAAMYLYLYSDLAVRRKGVYLPLAAFSLVMAEVTLIGLRVETEILIMVLAVTSVMMNALVARRSDDPMQLQRVADPLGILLSVVPVFLGFSLHMRGTGEWVNYFDWRYETGLLFFLAMALTAACTRVSAWLTRERRPQTSATYFFLSGGAAVLTAAGGLRMLGIVDWPSQAPLLMLIPIAYMIAARLWRGYAPERPLGNVAHTVTAVILLLTVFSGVEELRSVFMPIQQQTINLLLGATFAEATLFYILAAIFRRRSANVYLAAAAGCGAIWQLLGYIGVDTSIYTLLYASLGFGLLMTARSLGIDAVKVYDNDGDESTLIQGKGLAFNQCGNGILTIASLSAFLRGLSEVASSDVTWLGALVLLGMLSVALLSSMVVPAGGWRRFHITSAIAIGGVAMLTLNTLTDLTGWQKFEIFLVTFGVILTGTSYISLFLKDEEQTDEHTSLGLWSGSLLACLPVLIAAFYHRMAGTGPHLPDDIGLLTVSILLVITGLMWQVKSTTFIGGGSLMLFLIVLVGRLAWQPQVAVGVYLAAGGAFVFAAGILLSVYREKLLALPERIAKREGIFQMMNWR